MRGTRRNHTSGSIRLGIEGRLFKRKEEEEAEEIHAYMKERCLEFIGDGPRYEIQKRSLDLLSLPSRISP